MNTAITLAHRAVQLTGMTQVVLGLPLWTGRAPGVRTAHMMIGMGFVLALWALAGLAAGAGRGRRLAAATAGQGLVIPVFGVLHPRLLPRPGHWMIRLLHLALGVAGMVLAARLERAARRGAPRRARGDRAVPAGGVTVAGLALLCLGAPGPAEGQAAEPVAEVYVLSTLYRRHAEVPAYGHDTLRALIERVRPAAVVLDVSPRELRERTVHPSKAEYPEVIFPLLARHGYRAYPGEPDEPRFSEIVGRLGRALESFRAGQPAAAEADAGYEKATFAALAHHWRSPAEVNGALTDELLAARRHFQDRLAGTAVADAWRQWNAHAVGVIRRAVGENPGGRVLVLVGVENAALLRPALRELPGLRVVDMEDWIGASAQQHPVAD